jgi:hypothetical protein
MSSRENTKEVQKYWNWKVVCIFFSSLTLIALMFLVGLRDFFISRIRTELLSKYYTLFVFIIFFNMALATYTISLYYYRINKHGMKGAKGKYGKKGDKGDSNQCNIQTQRKLQFRLDKIPKVEEYNVDTDRVLNSTLDLNRRAIKPKWFNIISEDNKEGTTNYKSPDEHVLGNKFSRCTHLDRESNRCKINNGNNNRGNGVIENVYDKNTDKTNVKLSTKPFNGAILNYETNPTDTIGKIKSLQFTYDKNQPMRKNRVKLGMVGSRLGSQVNKGTGGEFTCPPHSSVYKIETLHDMDTLTSTGKLVGMKFHCKDIKSGKHVKVLNADNNYVDNIHFGVNPSPSNKLYKYGKVECGNYQRCSKDNPDKCSARPGFLSNYTAIDDKDGVVAVKFNKCSYLEPNPIKDYID